MDYNFWYGESLKASKKLGWLPQVIFTHWYHETAGFTSHNLKSNNNIAGQTWYKGCPYPKGSARPVNEGGYYIKFPSAVDGYVWFIQNNTKRYGEVKTGKTVAEQFYYIKKGGWATDPEYTHKLVVLYNALQDKGLFHYKEPVKPKEKQIGLVDYLKSKHKAYDFNSRRKLAYCYGVVSNPNYYTGTEEQNIALLHKLQK
jgi:hypothetical protein